MAISKVIGFNWEKILAVAGEGEAIRPLLQLRAKANEVAASHAKFAEAPAPIDFKGYKKKLKFVAASVDSLEKMYSTRKLPKYVATLPDFEAKKRAALVAAALEVSKAAEADLIQLKSQLENFDKNRFTDDSSVSDAAARFPHFAKQVDEEINEHDWLNDKTKNI